MAKASGGQELCLAVPLLKLHHPTGELWSTSEVEEIWEEDGSFEMLEHVTQWAGKQGLNLLQMEVSCFEHSFTCIICHREATRIVELSTR